MQPISYIDGNAIKGIKYDYELINREFKTMLKECNAPEGLYMPTSLPLSDTYWHAIMSERSSSKTTQLILYMGIIWKIYKGECAYIRQSKEQITSTMLVTLFNVVKMAQYGYIEYITENLYSDIYVDKNKHCYFANIDGNGKVIDKADSPFMYILSVDQYARYCSSLNVPMCDHLIFDEFSWGNYLQDGFIKLCQLIATIRRERRSVRIIMASNTISPYNQYLQELGISQMLGKLKKGQHAIVTSALGTRVYCELLNVGIHQTVEFNSTALSYFGFANESLRSLYGGEWEVRGFKHLPHSENRTVTPTTIFIDVYGNMLRVNSFSDGKQYGLFISRYTGKVKDDAYIISSEPVYNPDNYNNFNVNFINRLKTINKSGNLYVSDNEVGILIYELFQIKTF